MSLPTHYLSRHHRGMTLIEVTIAVAIMGMVMGAIAVSMNGASVGDLRADGTKMAALIRQTYQEAILTGKIHRLSFDLEKETVSLQVVESAFLPDLSEGAEAFKKEDEDDADFDDLLPSFADLEAAALEAFPDEDEDMPLGALSQIFLGQMGGGDAAMGNKGASAAVLQQQCEHGIDIIDVWTPGLAKPVSEGVGYLHFFPHGMTEDAYIHLGIKGDTTTFTLKVFALTGRSELVREFVEVPK